MKRVLLAALLACVVPACSPKGKAPLPSPNGALVLYTSIEESHSDPAGFECVIVEVRDKSDRVLFHENSHASAHQAWKIAWLSNESFQLMSADVGECIWKYQFNGTWRRQ